MKAKLLTLAALAAMLIGGLAWPNASEARPWRGYYGYGPARAYYGPYYGGYRYGYAQPYYRYRSGYAPGYYGPTYYNGYGYGYNGYGPRYYNSGYYNSRYYSPGVTVGAGPLRFYIR
jgi:hypothetical protein